MRPHPTILVALLGLAAIGCTEYTVQPDQDAIGDVEESGEPDIVVSPDVIDFGQVEVNSQGEQVEVVTVENIGDADLHISDVTLDDATAPFTIGAIQSVLVPPGQSTQFEVSFEPDTSEVSETYVLIDSDDPDTPTAQVLLTGEGIAPVIQIDPVDYDFGTVYVGCTSLLDVHISNVGNDTLVIEPDGIDFVTGSEDFSLLDLDRDLYGDYIQDDGSIVLQSGALDNEIVVQVAYSPLDDYDDVAYLRVYSNDPFTPEAQASQTGVGAIYATNTDVFEQPIEGATDIVFALDRSGSMSDDLASVADNFNVFVETLTSMDADYHVAATVNDDGCIVGPDVYIDNTFSTSEAQATMTTMMDLTGFKGSNTERAFMLLEACLSNTNLGPGGCNEGLIRDEAKMNLVCVSDEREQSVNSWSYYVAEFQAMKDDPDDVVIHAVGGDYPGGCGTAEPYEGAYEATVATGGLFLSICATDWASHLEILAEESAVALNSFELTQTPVPESITVSIDGVTSTVGWEYDESSNSVVFDLEHIPDGGSTIEISYIVAGDCEG